MARVVKNSAWMIPLDDLRRDRGWLQSQAFADILFHERRDMGKGSHRS